MDDLQPSTARRTLTASARLLGTLRLDGQLLLAISAISVMGLAILYSASGQNEALLWRQMMRLGLAMVAMIALAQVSPKHLRLWAPWVYAVGVLLLIVVAFAGEASKGAQRWLDLGVIRFQPSELMKLAVPMMCAWLLHERPLPPDLKVLALLGVLILVPVATDRRAARSRHRAPDRRLGSVRGAARRPARARDRRGAGPGARCSPGSRWRFLHDYQRKRVLTFLDPESDPLGAGYHIIQSQIAIGSGGVFGKGWMNGSQAQLEFLPERSTDFIFAVIGEEFGLLGTCCCWRSICS